MAKRDGWDQPFLWRGEESLPGKGSRRKHLQNLKCNIRRKCMTFAELQDSPTALPTAVLIGDRSRETLI